MAIPNEQRLIELLSEYIIKADQCFERIDRTDEKFAKQQEFLVRQTQRTDAILQFLIKHSETIKKIEQKLFDTNKESKNSNQNNRNRLLPI